MKTIAFFDAKPYDRVWFDQLAPNCGFQVKYLENRLTEDTAVLAQGADAVCAFVNDSIDRKTLDVLYDLGIRVIAMRCSGYNNIDFKSAFERIHVLRVPAYSPYAVAEHAIALLLTLNRKIHKAYIRTRDNNFSLSGLTGFDLHGKTIGIIGTGKVGCVLAQICQGFGMNILAFDLYPKEIPGVQYVPLEELYAQSDIISLHCPLTRETQYLINAESLSKMKDHVYLINTSRGALVDSEALLAAIKSGKIGGACLDVYEEESDVFFEDLSDHVLPDDTLSLLISMPNVLVTSHQAFLTDEALYNIAKVTLDNLTAYFDGAPLKNEICYRCLKEGSCDKETRKRCF